MRRIRRDKSGRLQAVKKARRRRVEVLLGACRVLKEDERALLRLYFEERLSLRKIAALTGIGEAAVRRRIRSCMIRMRNEKYVTVLRKRGHFTKQQRRILREHFVQGRSMATIAKRCGVSYYTVRKIVRNAKGLKNED